LGNIFADNVNLVKTIAINPTIINNQNAGNVSYYFNQSGSNILFNYLDPANLTQWVNMSVYASNGTFIAKYSAHNSNTVSFIHNMTDNDTYYAQVRIQNSWWADPPLDLQQWFSNVISAITGVIPAAYSATGTYLLPIGFEILQLIAGLGIITIPMFFDQANGSTGIIIDVFATIAFAAMGWWHTSIVVMLLALLLAVFNKMTEKRDVTQ
jgi:hypothetical protein